MPRRNFRKKRRTFRRKRRSRESKLRDKKINTLFEKRAKEIAEKEAKKLVVHKVFRQYFNYVDQLPKFNMHDVGAPVSLEGVLMPMHQIRRAQISTIPTTGFTTDMMSQRETNLIKITGFTIGLRAEWSRSNFDEADYEYNDLHYAVVAWRSALNPYLAPQNIPGPTDQNEMVNPIDQKTITLIDHRPVVSKLLPLKPWGYSAKLDNIYLPVTNAATPLPENWYQTLGPNERKKTIFRGVIKSGQLRGVGSRGANQIKTHTKYIKLKKPITIKYVEDDPSGLKTLGPWQYYFVFRSLIPTTAVENQMCLPLVSGFYKVHFIEP